jgi:hypothetical protein
MKLVHPFLNAWLGRDTGTGKQWLFRNGFRGLGRVSRVHTVRSVPTTCGMTHMTSDNDDGDEDGGGKGDHEGDRNHHDDGGRQRSILGLRTVPVYVRVYGTRTRPVCGLMQSTWYGDGHRA